MRYEVHCLDVWGNAEDGYYVNDVYPSCAEIELPEGYTDADMLRALRVDVLDDSKPDAFYEIEGGAEDETQYVNRACDGRPLLELRPILPTFSVIVGNIGTVYTGQYEGVAIASYEEYVNQSKQGYGRAAYDSVTIFRDNEIWREYHGQMKD